MKTLLRSVFLLVLILPFFGIKAQTPDAEIHVYEMKEKKGKITLSKGKNVTNRKGYDNQPHFFLEDYLLFTSQIDGQTDIMMLNLNEDELKNLTNSEVSEYSATMVPGFESFSVIRQDLERNQLLWLYHISGKSPSVLFDDIAPVGYHAWSGTDVAMFILGDPVTMLATSTKERRDRIITRNIGRTLKTIPDSNKIAFERTEEDGTIAIYALDPSTDKFDKIITKPTDASDWAITMNGTYITSVGSKLWKYNAKQDKEWVEFMDLDGTGKGVITRMAVSPDNGRIAIVIDH